MHNNQSKCHKLVQTHKPTNHYSLLNHSGTQTRKLPTSQEAASGVWNAIYSNSMA
ncbi:hypothetical protein GCM10007377_08220 [Galliscardovia ingluviei]|uniref:Uncharacterized protein n=1 Tax=Galliscardovia ingluviei TaxID=1769422 RepID=A0A8J3AJC5_9BIFI|nr:hypothetical protein GCM10007377_08220 [Galliscardovia ingluviei]